jgi:hypothetical protein
MRLPASGKRFQFTAVCVFDLRGRQIARERRIYDFTGLLMQVGVLKAKPEGLLSLGPNQQNNPRDPR